jgi:hypothetical protein
MLLLNEIKTMVLQPYFQNIYIFIDRNKCGKNTNILMVALSGYFHA